MGICRCFALATARLKQMFCGCCESDDAYDAADTAQRNVSMNSVLMVDSSTTAGLVVTSPTTIGSIGGSSGSHAQHERSGDFEDLNGSIAMGQPLRKKRSISFAPSHYDVRGRSMSTGRGILRKDGSESPRLSPRSGPTFYDDPREDEML